MCDDPAFGERAFTHPNPHARLLFKPRQWQGGVKQITRALTLTAGMVVHHCHHYFRVGKAGHGTVSAAHHFLWQEQAPVAAQDRDAFVQHAFAALVADLSMRYPKRIHEIRPINIHYENSTSLAITPNQKG